MEFLYGCKHDFTIPLKEKGQSPCCICHTTRPEKGFRCSSPDCFESAHEYCAELASEIEQHPIHPHPHHVLVLHQVRACDDYHCSVCKFQSVAFAYLCCKCRFNLCVRCSSLRLPITKEEASQSAVTSCNQGHPFYLCDTAGDLVFICSYCGSPMDSPFYVCIKCHLILHPLCYDIPREIRHPVHRIDHCLPLLPVVEGISNNCCCICRSFFCDVFPGNSWSTEMKNSAFQCRKCRVYVCVPCALSAPTKRIQLFGHPHPLFIMENRRNHMLRCCLCRVKSKDDIFISCFECKLIFHLSCGQDLAREIPLHPYHPLPKHPLQLLHESAKSSSSSRYEICPGCDEPIDAFHYRCCECGFAIDAYCAKQVPRSIKSETHEHPLSCFNENIKANKCSDCGGRICSRPYFRCVTCGYNLHVSCIPNLPLKVKNVHHGHFLTLTKHQVKDHLHDVDDTQFYCTSCERPRDLRDPTYSCDECHNFVSHFECVNLEIFRIWEEDGTLASIIDQKTDTSSNVLEEVENEVNITFEIGEMSSSNTSFVGPDQYINAPHKELEELETNIADLQREGMALKTEFEILCKKRETLAAQLEEARTKSTHLGRH